MKPFFVSDDFYTKNFIQRYIGSPLSCNFSIYCEEAAKFANEKLEKEGRVVYGNLLPNTGYSVPGEWILGASHLAIIASSHKAFLLNIESIETKCEHQEVAPITSIYQNVITGYLCVKCKKEVSPSGWIEK